MISKKEKILWLLYAAVLVLLFLLSSTDLIIKERERQVYRISVIIEDDTDLGYANFRKGMEHAAVDLNADVSFQTLYEANHYEQQMERILREQQDGADAVVVIPVDEERLAAGEGLDAVTAPLVVVNTRFAGDQAASVISVDYEKMGQMLGEEIAAAHENGTPVFTFSGQAQSSASRHFLDGATETLKQAGFSVCAAGEEDLPVKGSVVIAADPQRLEQAALLLSGSGDRGATVGLYGRGITQTILNSLEQGQITGICATDDFAMGYVSILRAVQAIQKETAQKETVLECHYVTGEELYEPEYERMLYPVE
ncbi:MAG: substrate-binding domain-containing protein [Clostridiales bacterium]|nr:substrate-binding domain-containing protein [Clostridiales bacterium]